MLTLIQRNYNDSVGLDEYQQFPSIAPRSKQFGLDVASLFCKIYF